MNALSFVTLIVSMTCVPVFASAYSNMATEDMAKLRTTMQQEAPAKRTAFQKEWQARVRQMSSEERQKYTGRGNGLGPQDGTGNHGSGSGTGRGAGSEI